MATVEIHETTVTQDGDGSIVRLVIADEPPHSETAPMFHLDLTVRVTESRSRSLAYIQRAAMVKVRDALRDLADAAYRETIQP